MTRPAAYVVVLGAEPVVACVSAAAGLFLPGGGIEDGERPEDAVRREVREECGRHLELVRPLPSAIQYFITATGRACELRASFFVGRFGAPFPGAREHDILWLPTSPLPTFYHECHAWAVARALSDAVA